jgi:hypothetical protein
LDFFYLRHYKYDQEYMGFALRKGSKEAEGTEGTERGETKEDSSSYEE